MKEYEIINQTIDKLSGKGAVVIEHYANWYIYDAIVCVILGMLLIPAAIYGIKKALSKKGDWDIEAIVIVCIISSVIGLVGLICLLSNIPDLLEPQARAYHGLITDITGGKR